MPWAPETACAHTRVRTAKPLVTDRGPQLLLPSPNRRRCVLVPVNRPVGSAEKEEKVFQKTTQVVLVPSLSRPSYCAMSDGISMPCSAATSTSLLMSG